MLDSGTLSPLLKKMEKAGLIERRRGAGDDRVVLITLTEKGKELQEKAQDVPRGVGSCVELAPEKAQELYKLLYELINGQNDNMKGEAKQ